MEDFKALGSHSAKKGVAEAENNEYKNFIKFLLSTDQIQYWIGNPSVELITGTLFFRKNILEKSLEMEDKNSKLNEIHSKVLAVLGIPTNKSLFEFCDMIKAFENNIIEMRVLKTSTPRFYATIICFTSIEKTREFYEQFSLKKFNALEEEMCFLKEVQQINIKYEQNQLRKRTNEDILKNLPFLLEEEEKLDPLNIFIFNINERKREVKSPLFSKKDRKNFKMFLLDSQKVDKEVHECDIRYCPICFEELSYLTRKPPSKNDKHAHKAREDKKEHGSAAIGILCGHYFHWRCLEKWNDSTCPLCRYHQQPPETSYCEKCGRSDDLWMCLVCGFIGCGLEDPLSSHNHEHYEETKHVYAMEVETKFVFDHAQKVFIHRLIQNSVDGKMVEVNGMGEGLNRDEGKLKKKGDIEKIIGALTFEYNMLMTSQYENQRLYFEEEMKGLKKKHDAKRESQKFALDSLNAQIGRAQSELAETLRERDETEAELKKEKDVMRQLLKDKMSIDKENQELSETQRKLDGEIKGRQEDQSKKLKQLRAQIKNLELEIKDIEIHKKEKKMLQEKLDEGDKIDSSIMIIVPNEKGKKKRK